MQCGAKTRNGSPCRSKAMTNGRCRMHGGNQPNGIAHHCIQHGRYSKYLPVRLKEQYEVSTNDGELLSIREDIALLDSRITDVMASASNQESGELWNSLKEALHDYDHAGGKNAEADRFEAMQKIRWLIREGYAEWQSWKDIRFMLQERRQLVESERKRLVDMQQMITAERAATMIVRIQDIIRTHVTDRDTLRGIAEEFRKLALVESR